MRKVSPRIRHKAPVPAYINTPIELSIAAVFSPNLDIEALKLRDMAKRIKDAPYQKMSMDGSVSQTPSTEFDTIGKTCAT